MTLLVLWAGGNQTTILYNVEMLIDNDISLQYNINVHKTYNMVYKTVIAYLQ